MPIVYVLLATYNGERFLNQQLESIQKQIGVTVKVIANDDGSTDGTLEILNNWERKGLIESVTTSNRIGASASFLKLVGDYFYDAPVAFADQDDVWLPTKLINLYSLLQNTPNPTLAFSRRSYINRNGSQIGQSTRVRRQPSWENAVIQNIVYCNCILLNSSGVSLLRKIDIANVFYFDAYCYLIFSLFGELIYCDDKLVQYRLHEDNLVGARHGSQFNLFVKGTLDLQKQANRVANHLSATSALKSETYVGFKKYIHDLSDTNLFNRIVAILHSPVYRQNPQQTLLVKIFLAIHTLSFRQKFM